MADTTLNPVEALDKQWAEEQADLAKQPEKTPEEEKPADTKQVDTPKEKPEDNKQEHAFKEMRAEIAALKKQLEEAKATKESTPAKAEEQAVPPKVLEELELTKKELREIKESMTQKEKTTRIEGFNGELNRFAEEYGLSDDEIRSIVDQMGADGYTIDTVTAVPTKSIGKIIKGYAADLVAEKVKQNTLKGKKKFQEEKLTDEPTGTDDPFSADALKKEMEAYARKNKPWLNKK